MDKDMKEINPEDLEMDPLGDFDRAFEKAYGFLPPKEELTEEERRAKEKRMAKSRKTIEKMYNYMIKNGKK